MRPDTNTFPLEAFYIQLVEMEGIQDELKDRFGKKEAKRIIDDIRRGESKTNSAINFDNFIGDYIDNESDETEILYASGGYGEYLISIMNFGPVYWIRAMEYDPIGYFKTEEEAVSCAESTYETKG